MDQSYSAEGSSNIDFILVYSKRDHDHEVKEKRDFFLSSLSAEGLKCETDDEECRNEVFVKVHAPFDTLARYAEFMKLRKPIKQTLIGRIKNAISYSQVSFKCLSRCMDFLKIFHHKDGLIPSIEHPFTLHYSGGRKCIFAIPSNENEFFTGAERSMIVDYILRRAHYTDYSGMFGVSKLLQDGVFLAAYPLHEAHVQPSESWNTRRLLYETWAHPKNVFKTQPLDHIRLYFGENIGLYFAWLGFYTYWLIPASIMGVSIFLYGFIVEINDVVMHEVCNSNITMCPLCRNFCPFWNLSHNCQMARLGRTVENEATVFFTVFMAFWSTLFLEQWKRYQAKLAYKWCVYDLQPEIVPPRPEFQSLVETKRFGTKRNILSGKEEPIVPFWTHRVPMRIFSFVTVMFLISLAIAFVAGVTIYKIIVYTTLKAQGDGFLFKSAPLFTAVTGALVNLITIMLLNRLYHTIAIWLTNKEHHRTQPEYDDDLTLKLYLLKFVNFYASIFYIAFIKGRTMLANFRFAEMCHAGGCLIELTVQMTIIMIGKQIIEALTETFVPHLRKRIAILRYQRNSQWKLLSHWEVEYQLADQGPRPLFFEYLEMMIQFGFMTIFGTAFPLAPLFALLNNISEIRCDAEKFLMLIRRPVAQRAKTIGIWQTLLVGISRLAILVNASIIALTSDLIPRIVYAKYYSPKQGSLSGFVNFSLSYVNATTFHPKVPYNGTYCRLSQYRNPPWSEKPGELSPIYWHILAAKLTFIFVFENVVLFLTPILAWLIPDVSLKVKVKMIREVTLVNEILLKAELHQHNISATVDVTDNMNNDCLRFYEAENANKREISV